MKNLLLIFFTLFFANTLFASTHDQHEIDCSGKSSQEHCVQHILEPMDHHDHKSDSMSIAKTVTVITVERPAIK